MLFYRLLEQADRSPPRTYRSLVADPVPTVGCARPRDPTSAYARPAGQVRHKTGRGADPQQRRDPKPHHCTEMENPLQQVLGIELADIAYLASSLLDDILEPGSRNVRDKITPP